MEQFFCCLFGGRAYSISYVTLFRVFMGGGMRSTLGRRSITCWFEDPAGFTFRGGPGLPCRLRYDNLPKTTLLANELRPTLFQARSPMAVGFGRGMAAWAAKGSYLVTFPMPQAFALAGHLHTPLSLDQALCRALHATPASPLRGPRSARQGCLLISAA